MLMSGGQREVLLDLLQRSFVSPALGTLSDAFSERIQLAFYPAFVNKEVIDAEALIDEGGYGFEPSLYIVSHNQDRVCSIVEDLAKSMEAMS